jgi:hypothetical protein
VSREYEDVVSEMMALRETVRLYGERIKQAQDLLIECKRRVYAPWLVERIDAFVARRA